MRTKSDFLKVITAGALFALSCVTASGSEPDVKDPRVVELLKTFVEEFVQITPGEGKFPTSFTMGSADGPANEQPAHDVILKDPFSIGKYEVTQDLYQAIMGKNPSKWKGPRNSVEMVTWIDAVAFCQKITTALRETQLISQTEAIRLPTEVEWEYCCRAGSATKYSFGNEAQPAGEESFDVILEDFGESKIQMIKIIRQATKPQMIKIIRQATGLGLSDAKSLVESTPRPLRLVLTKDEAAKLVADIKNLHGVCQTRKALLIDKYAWHTGNAAGNDPPVGVLKPNPWGLYDMHGYLWEFTADQWSNNYASAINGKTADKLDQQMGKVVIRSGSWKDSFEKLTSTTR